MNGADLIACRGLLVDGTTRRIGVCRSCARWQLDHRHAGWRVPLIPAAAIPPGQTRMKCVNKSPVSNGDDA